MANLSTKRAFLLALSHREKARALMSEVDHAFAQGSLDAERHGALRDFYTTHLQRAELRLTQLQDRERRKLASLEHQLRATINDRARLVDRAVAGKITAEKANNLNRKYQEDVANLENAIDATDSLLNAAHSADLGGFVDLPIEEYDVAQQQPVSPIERWRARRWAILFAGAFVALLMIFLVIRQGPAGQDVEAEFESADPATVNVTVTLSGSGPAELLVPFPENGAAILRGAEAPPRYGLQLYVQEQGRDSFNLLPGSDECWRNNGMPVLGAPVALIANIPVSITLDLSRLHALTNSPQAVKVLLVSPRGSPLDEAAFTVPPPSR